MIDLHCHIVPDVDDGAQTEAESRAMLAQAASTGITELAATSHYSGDAWRRYPEALEKLRQLAEEHHIKIHAGAEYDFSRLEEAEQLQTLGDSSYVLIDFVTPYISPNAIAQRCEDLLNRKYKLLIAHPERLFPADKLKVLQSLAEQGAYFQLNAGSFLGNFGRGAQRQAEQLLKLGLCHCVASDAHNAGSTRGFCLKKCHDYLIEHHNCNIADRLVLINPQRILADQYPFPVVEPAAGAESSWWGRLKNLFRPRN